MPNNKYPFTLEEFQSIYSKVPRLTIDLIIKNNAGAIYLTKRAIEPCKGQWHLPGGTLYFGESIDESVDRLAYKEVGIQVKSSAFKGYIEYPSHYLKKIDHPLALVFEITDYSGTLKIDKEASDGDWFSKMPKNMHADQDAFMLRSGYLGR